MFHKASRFFEFSSLAIEIGRKKDAAGVCASSHVRPKVAIRPKVERGVSLKGIMCFTSPAGANPGYALAVELVEHCLHLTESVIVTGAFGAGDAGFEALDGFRVPHRIGESLSGHEVAGGVVRIVGKQS